LVNSIYTINQITISLHKEISQVGYKVKIQRVDRGATKSFYINFPAAVAEASKIEKGEDLEWVIEDKNTFILQRVKKIPPRPNKLEMKNKVETKPPKK